MPAFFNFIFSAMKLIAFKLGVYAATFGSARLAAGD